MLLSGRPPDDVVEGMQPDELAGIVNHRNFADPQAAHQVQHRGAGGIRPNDVRCPVGVLVDESVEFGPLEQAAADVAVGKHALELACLVGDEGDRGRAAVDGLQRLPNGGVLPDADVAEGPVNTHTCHSPAPMSMKALVSGVRPLPTTTRSIRSDECESPYGLTTLTGQVLELRAQSLFNTSVDPRTLVAAVDDVGAAFAAFLPISDVDDRHGERCSLKNARGGIPHQGIDGGHDARVKRPQAFPHYRGAAGGNLLEFCHDFVPPGVKTRICQNRGACGGNGLVEYLPCQCAGVSRTSRLWAGGT